MQKREFESTKFFSGIKAIVMNDALRKIKILVSQADFDELAIWDQEGNKYELDDIIKFIED